MVVTLGVGSHLEGAHRNRFKRLLLLATGYAAVQPMQYALCALEAVSQPLADRQMFVHFLNLAHAREEHEDSAAFAAVAAPCALGGGEGGGGAQ